MADKAPELFRNRSTTQDFLYSQSDGTHEVGAPAAACAPGDDAADASVMDHFPDLLSREALVDAIETRMHKAAALCMIAVDIEPSTAASAIPDTPSGGQIASVVAVLEPLAVLCRDHGGIWGQIAPHRFALALADRDIGDARALAESLRGAWPDPEAPPATIGIAAYPTLDDTRGQTVDNAVKALDHGSFFGPGSITAFDAVSLNISGDRHYQAGDIHAAIADFEKGLRLAPADVNLLNSLGVCHGVLKDFDSAFKSFDKAMALDPDAIMPLYNKGYLLLLQGDRDAALTCFLAAHAREPDIFEVVFHLGQTLMAQNDARRAHDYLVAATQANSRSGPAHKLLGDCLTALGSIRKAIQAYKTAVKINPEDAESLSSLGWLYSRIDESLDVAEVLCAQSVRLAPDNGLFRHRLGLACLQQGKRDAALAEFEAAVARGHDSRPQIARVQAGMTDAKAS